MAQTLQNKKDNLKIKLKECNTALPYALISGTTATDNEMQEMFNFIDNLNANEFKIFSRMIIIIINDAYDTGYENGVYEAEKTLKD